MAFACGLGAGVIQAGLFNPYDRALFLSVRDKSPFLHADNFRRPYQGFLQSVGGRAISGGLFFPLESVIRSLSEGHHRDDDGNRLDVAIPPSQCTREQNTLRGGDSQSDHIIKS